MCLLGRGCSYEMIQPLKTCFVRHLKNATFLSRLDKQMQRYSRIDYPISTPLRLFKVFTGSFIASFNGLKIGSWFRTLLAISCRLVIIFLSLDVNPGCDQEDPPLAGHLPFSMKRFDLTSNCISSLFNDSPVSPTISVSQSTPCKANLSYHQMEAVCYGWVHTSFLHSHNNKASSLSSNYNRLILNSFTFGFACDNRKV